MSAEQFFIEQFNKCIWVEDDKKPGNIFMVYDKYHERKMKLSSILNDSKEFEFIKTDDTIVLFYQDHKNGYLDCNYGEVWTVFRDKFGLKYQEIKDLIVDVLNNETKLKVLTPKIANEYTPIALNNETKLKVLTPNQTILLVLEKLNNETKLKVLKTGLLHQKNL